MYRIIGAFLFTIALVGCDGAITWPNTVFSEKNWKSTHQKDRYVWANDLIATRQLIDRSKAEVIELLGPPSLDRSPAYLEYIVKQGGRGFTKLYFLEIRLNDDKVTEVSIKGD